MADRYYPVSLTVPANSGTQIPVGVDVPTENAFLVDVEIVIPSGHAGLTGVRVTQSSQQIVPWGNSSFITGDNYRNTFLVNTEVGADSLRLEGYNSDIYAHTFDARFHIRDTFEESRAQESFLSSTSSAIMGLTP